MWGSAWARKRGEETGRRGGRGGAWPSGFVGCGVADAPAGGGAAVADGGAAPAELGTSRVI